MPDERLRIVIEAQDNATAQLKGLSTQLNGLKASGQNASAGLSGAQKAMGLLKAVAASYVIKEGVQMIAQLAQLGAENERVYNGFVAVSGGAENAASTLEALRIATRGAKSDVELMTGATNILALGLADNAEDLGNIVRNVEALGSRFGGTMQIFQLMMSNQSLMRIDSFGVGVEEATKRINEYKSAGLSAQDAFKTAILELMTEKFTDLGGAVDDSKLETERATASWKNFTNEMGLGFKDMGAGVAKGGAQLLDWLTEAQKRYALARKEHGLFAGSVIGFFDALSQNLTIQDQWAARSDEGIKATASLTGAMYEQRIQAENLVEFTKAETKAINSKDVALRQMQIALGETVYQMEEYVYAEEEAVKTSEFMQTRFNELSAVFNSNLTPSLEDARDKLGELRGEASTLKDKIAELEGKQYLTGAQKEELAGLKTELGEVQGAIQGVISDTEKMMASFVINMAMAQVTVDGLITETETNFVASLGVKLGLWDSTYAGMMRTVQEAHTEIEAGHIGATEGAQMVVDANTEVVESYVEIPAAAVPALAEVEVATGANKARMIELGIEAQTTQGIISSMTGKNIDLYITTHERTVRHAQSALDFEEQITGAPGQAAGTDNWRGGMTWVGERGPELVNLPRGSQVYDAQASRNIVNNHNYDVTVNTAAQSGTYLQDIALAQAMAQ